MCEQTVDNLIYIWYIKSVDNSKLKTCYYTIYGDNAEEVHLFSSRTQKLSSSGPIVLVWWRTGRVGRCRISKNEPSNWFFFYAVVRLREQRFARKLHFQMKTLEWVSFFVLMHYGMEQRAARKHVRATCWRLFGFSILLRWI